MYVYLPTCLPSYLMPAHSLPTHSPLVRCLVRLSPAIALPSICAAPNHNTNKIWIWVVAEFVGAIAAAAVFVFWYLGSEQESLARGAAEAQPELAADLAAARSGIRPASFMSGGGMGEFSPRGTGVGADSTGLVSSRSSNIRDTRDVRDMRERDTNRDTRETGGSFGTAVERPSERPSSTARLSLGGGQGGLGFLRASSTQSAAATGAAKHLRPSMDISAPLVENDEFEARNL